MHLVPQRFRIFTNKEFARFARKCGISDTDLCEAAHRISSGLSDVNLGGGLSKQRIARKGRGKSGGFRTILILRTGAFCIFINGFAKNHVQTSARESWRNLSSSHTRYSPMTTKPSQESSSRKSSSKSSVTKMYRSSVSAATHQFAEELFNAGVLSKKTMRELDESCLTPIKHFAPAELEALRKREDVSQAVFARHLGLSTNLISQWERGEKKPSGSALKLLSLIDKNGLDFVA